jgi:hypothetical protein
MSGRQSSPRYYSVIPCGGDGLDHCVLDEHIWSAVGDQTQPSVPALCAHQVVPDRNLDCHRRVRCADCVDKLVLFNPALQARREPPILSWSARSAPLTQSGTEAGTERALLAGLIASGRAGDVADLHARGQDGRRGAATCGRSWPCRWHRLALAAMRQSGRAGKGSSR